MIVLECGKVSVIAPCFNGENYVSLFLESILEQSYNNIELIFINDGSTDNTENIVLSYEQKFINRGYDFKYFYQNNAGQAAALNKGLKFFTGKFLTWPDSDDRLHPKSVEKRVRFLQKNTQYGFVRSTAYIFDESDLGQPIGMIRGDPLTAKKENIFEDLITESTYCTPGCYLVRSKAFLSVNPKKEIYLSRGGQNWQMLLPISYYYKCGFIDEPLFYYTFRKESHSHNLKGIKEKLDRCDIHKDILVNVLKSMNIEDRDYYLDLIEEKYIRKNFRFQLIVKKKALLRSSTKK